MARTFRGESLNKVDGKGRVSIPALFRRVLETCDPDYTDGLQAQVVIVYGLDNQKYLECYTMEAAAEVDAKIAALPRGSKPRRLLETIFHGRSHPTSVDETGRLVLPQKLRDKIGLEGEAYFVAASDTFQIWRPETYDEVMGKQTEALLEDLPDDFDPMELLEGGGL